MPSAGGVVDLYLRSEANPAYPGFAECFANGVNRNRAAVLAAVQRPAALAQLGEPSGPPAWETIPSWALTGTADRVITPAQQEAMATNAGAQISTVKAGHLSLVSRPTAVTTIIQTPSTPRRRPHPEGPAGRAAYSGRPCVARAALDQRGSPVSSSPNQEGGVNASASERVANSTSTTIRPCSDPA